MKKVSLLAGLFLILIPVAGQRLITFAQQSTIFKSNTVITKVGSPSAPRPGTGGTVSCPVEGGIINTPSYQADPKTGHCNDNYLKKYSCNCGTIGRRAKAIDVVTGGKNVQLPKIEGQQVEWKLITKNYLIFGGEGGGVGNTFEAESGTDKWYLDVLHLENTQLTLGQKYPSDTPIAKSVISHAHMTIGKNLQRSPTAGSATDCDPGWLPSDFMCR